MIKSADHAAGQRLWQAIFAAIPALPSLLVSEWAEKHRFLSAESSSEPGKFKCDRIPYQREPMDAPLDENVEETVLWWAAQLGKSETMNNVTGFFMHGDPSSILMVQPTIDLVEAYSMERIAPMIRDTPVLRRIVRDPRSRSAGNTTKFKKYPGGNLAMVGANAPGGLAGRPRRVILQDEIDRFPASAGTEGDPCALADKRAETFPDAVRVKTSTATIKGKSKIESRYEQSDKRQWHVRCPKCRHEFVMMWQHVQWPDGKPDEAWLECPASSCKARLNETDRIEMVRLGRWKPTAPFKGVRGYWLNGINTLFRHHRGYKSRLHEFVADFLKAKDGGQETMKVWINTFLAETYEEESEKLDANEILNRLEDYAPDEMPDEVLILTASVDVHRMFLQCDVVGWGLAEESWGITHKQFDGDTEKDEVWSKLDQFLGTEFTRSDGVKMKLSRVFVDMGYRDKRVLAFCAPRISRGVYPCKGVRREGINIPPLLPAKPNRNNHARIPHWPVGVTVAKSAIYDRVMLPTPGPRTMHFAREQGYSEAYFKELTIEVRKTKHQFGKPYSVFVKPNNASRNEALDLNVYNLAALASMFPIAWTKLAENLKKSAPKMWPPVMNAHFRKPETIETTMNEDGTIERTENETKQVSSDIAEPSETPTNPEKKAPHVPTPSNPAHPKAPMPSAPRAMRPFRRGGGFVQRWR